MICRAFAIVFSLPVMLSCLPASADGEFRVLVFSKTVGFRHGSIDDGIALVQSLGTANGFAVDTTEDAADFNSANLSQYAVVIWLSTTGDVLDDAQQAAFEAYIQNGGGWVGVHAATDCEYGWPWYGGLIGGNAWFQSHPSIQTATLNVEDATHESTVELPASFSIQDEWYNFQNNPRPSVNVLVTIDESSYDAGADAMGDDHPISWYHEYDGGRAWYTALGHRDQTFADSRFQSHLLGGIQWAAGVCRCPGDANNDARRDGLDVGAFLYCLFAADLDCRCADADANGALDLGDVAAIVDALLGEAGSACPA
jgi:type 1 glutamine amidotransferase